MVLEEVGPCGPTSLPDRLDPPLSTRIELASLLIKANLVPEIREPDSSTFCEFFVEPHCEAENEMG